MNRRFGVWVALLASGFYATACEGAPTQRVPVDAHFLIVRLNLDPSTRIGEVVTRDERAAVIDAQLDTVACDAAQIAVIHIQQSEDPAELGDVSLLIATAVDAGDLCVGGGRVAVQPASYRPETGEPVVAGPLLIEGRSLDGRLPISRYGGGLSVFPEWWQVSGRAVGLLRPEGEDVGVSRPLTAQDGLRIEEAEASAVWTARQLAQNHIADFSDADPTIEGTLLDIVVFGGVQPDVDRDADGFETLLDEDADGEVDACLDGDGTRIEGADCPLDPRIADGYALSLIFRLEPAEPI